jgi:hypothetical protein
MAEPHLPRILNPNLGCPELVSLPADGSSSFEVVLALPRNDPDWGLCGLRAVPSHPGAGSEVPLWARLRMSGTESHRGRT